MVECICNTCKTVFQHEYYAITICENCLREIKSKVTIQEKKEAFLKYKEKKESLEPKVITPWEVK